jgi:hypothetical protein
MHRTLSHSPPSNLFSLAIDGQHHLYVRQPDGTSLETELDSVEAEIVQAHFHTLVALIVKRRAGKIDDAFVLRPIAEKMEFIPHGDQMNVHMFVEQFRLPFALRMSFDAIGICMRKALEAMRVAAN